jgi:Na+-transporting NADH:ubiquinone oxidoreductase subunit F
MLETFLYSVAMLAGLGGLFAAMLIVADRVLANYGPCDIGINEREPITVEGGCTLLDALYDHEIFIPSGCGGQGTCGHCKVTVLSGGGPVLPTELPLLTKEELAAGVRLACQVKVKEAIRIRIPQHYFDIRQFQAIVEDARMLTHDMREIRLRLADPTGIDFRPGQYVQVQVPTRTGPVHRAYSISSSPDEPGVVELVVRLIPGGVGSTYMHSVQPGEPVKFTGPFGEFVLSADPQTEVVCVAGGCGVAPTMSIIHYMLKRWPERRCTLFFGVRTQDDLFYQDEFEQIRRQWPGFSVHCALSEPERAGEWDGETGFVHLSVDRHLDGTTPRQAFLCGPPPMIEATERVLRDKDVPPRMIFYENW